MRVIQAYQFKLGSKIPYSDCPAIVHRFLEDQNLVSHHFMYCFDELFSHVCLEDSFVARGARFVEKSLEEMMATGSCAKAVKDCPALGEIRFLNGDNYGMSKRLFLSNIDIDTGCTEADILPLMKKIHRRYGFSNCNLYYSDINFFQRLIPWERDMTYAKKRAEYFQCELDPALFLDSQPYGSGICLHRNSASENCIILSIDILHDGQIYDASGYCDAMKALLPHIHPAVSMEIYLTEEEQERIAQWGHQIAPAVEKARNYFAGQYPGHDRQNLFSSEYSPTAKLKKLAKAYGFSYHYEGFGVYVLDKRTPRGHVLRLAVDSGPSHCDTTYHVSMQGIGFTHELCATRQLPTNQAESDACSEKMFSLVSQFEQTILPELDSYYDETPEWFIASRPW